MDFPDLLTERLRLRPFRETDLPVFAAYRCDKELCRYQSWDTFDDAQLQAFWQQQKALPFGQIGSWYQIAIAERESDRMLGDCAVHFLTADQVELGFTLPFRFQDKGYMTEALQALRQQLMARTAVRTLLAYTDLRNTPSQRLLERLGFIREKVIERAGFYKGEWCDDALYRWPAPSETQPEHS